MGIIVTFFLAFSLLLYCLFAGADFGAGILEFFRRKGLSEKTEALTNKAIGPVWEANHIWLIILVVVLFMGFPPVFTTVSTWLHIPLTALLIGIIFRGCFFTFRHYDLIQDESDRYYSAIFAFSSLASAVFIGITAGALKLGRINPEPSGFYEGFIYPWFNLFSFSVGIFTAALFAFLSAVYLIGEGRERFIPRFLIAQALRWNVVIVISGALVFVFAELEGLDLLTLFLSQAIVLTALILATALLPLVWLSIRYRKVLYSRLLAGAQVFLILFAWVASDFPVIVHLKDAEDLTVMNSLAPPATLDALGWALIVGSVFILPAFVYLLVTFKREE